MPSSTIAITGGSGFVGTRLSAYLDGLGCEVRRLVRREPRDGQAEIRWDPAAGAIDAASLEGLSAVVHLAGENIAGRWTARRKRAIRESRVGGTAFLARTLAGLEKPPPVLICASAVGFYGDRGDELLDETSPAGQGYLPEVVRAWEDAAEPARKAGIRVVHLRIGVVLSPAGGALRRMLPAFRLGLGGRVGRGGQYVSWIAMEDLVRAVSHAIQDRSIEGAVNAVSPEPVTNLELTRVLAKVLRRPAAFPVPALLVRVLFGEMGRDLLLSSTRAVPTRLEASHFRFLHTTLEHALRFELDLA